MQLSKWRECKPTDAEKLLSQWEKVAKCNFKSNALARPRMLKSFFLSERKFLNAILRVKLKYMKDVFFSWNEMSFALQKTDFHVLELFCKASHIRASMHRITSLELLRTLMLCFVQLSKLRELKAMDAEKLLPQWKKVSKCNFKSKAQVHERCFFLMKWNVICNAEDRFSCVRSCLQSKSCQSFNAQNH